VHQEASHSAAATSGTSGAGEVFLAALGDPDRKRLYFRLTVVVAHPDDETIGCGSLLARSNDVTVMHVTDGAPRNLLDAQALGFGSAEAYAQARRGELEAAMALAGLPADRLIWLGWSDQEASLHLVDIAHDLSRRLSGTDIVLTHAYEGGHPDHDATAFATHAAAALLRSRGEPPPEIIEFPLYRAGPEGWIAQSFSSEPRAGELAFELLTDERALKEAMFNVHASQRQVLSRFSISPERFRVAPRYDFSSLPNGGDLLYELMEWGMPGARWLEFTRAALAELRLATTP